MNLVRLGGMLEERRKALGMPRAELARLLGVSENYVWLVERARRRKNGNPTQPSKELLEKWVAALRWGTEQRGQILELAGRPDPVPYVPSPELAAGSSQRERAYPSDARSTSAPAVQFEPPSFPLGLNVPTTREDRRPPTPSADSKQLVNMTGAEDAGKILGGVLARQDLTLDELKITTERLIPVVAEIAGLVRAARRLR